MSPAALKTALERLLAALAHIEGQPETLKTRAYIASVANRFGVNRKSLEYALAAKRELTATK